jgi:hypothetical protein
MSLSSVIDQPENWRPVVGFEGIYEVSDAGRVRNVKTGRLRTPFERKPLAYHAYYLTSPTRSKCLLAHSMVLSAFVGERPEGLITRHLNGNPRDNRLANLAWGTPAENGSDQRRHGRSPAGERNGSAKLTLGDVAAIRASSLPATYLCQFYGVTPVAIQKVKRGETWASA